MIAILDYDAGNIKSVEKAITSLGGDAVVTSKRSEILKADHVILPGVGAFGDAMKKLSEYELVDTIHEVVKRGTPFLGICLGLQLLFEDSEETPGVAGLGLLPGHILRIPDAPGIKIPHIGWNSLTITPNAGILKGLGEEPYVYFVHSYYLKSDDPKIVIARTHYGVEIHAAVEKDNLFAVQFHPEKSEKIGMRMLQNFLSL